ncbi:hypothetical protein BBO_08230 [Beauveria brongniartii RCEF 3172]|uniref:Uncharacterized protein n=1 Tax=Beauveria brongniartii RCEF 3172 TaxID=1081107 RepID=A0A166XZ38_9HYPO|nr:hypothetical protein BBO_08230 [Beauveria brongniartii RCEF 3172]
MVQSTVEYGTMLTQVICRGAPVSFLTTSARKNSARTSAIQNPRARIAAPLGGLWPSESNHSETTSEDPAEALKCTLGQLAGSSQRFLRCVRLRLASSD